MTEEEFDQGFVGMGSDLEVAWVAAMRRAIYSAPAEGMPPEVFFERVANIMGCPDMAGHLVEEYYQHHTRGSVLRRGEKYAKPFTVVE